MTKSSELTVVLFNGQAYCMLPLVLLISIVNTVYSGIMYRLLYGAMMWDQTNDSVRLFTLPTVGDCATSDLYHSRLRFNMHDNNKFMYRPIFMSFGEELFW